MIAASGNEQRRTDLATCENQIPDLRGLGIKVAATTVLDQLAEYRFRFHSNYLLVSFT